MLRSLFPLTYPEVRPILCADSSASSTIHQVQGSGKSHSVSLILESMLIKDPRIGPLSSPLSAAVFHFGEPGGAAAPCEAAFIANCADKNVRPPPVVVCESCEMTSVMRPVRLE